MNATTEKFPLDQIVSHKILAASRLDEIGCSTVDCEAEPTHVALVAIELANGRKLSMVKHYCSTCALVATHTGGAEA